MAQAIQTKYIAPTDHKGARVKAFCAAGSVTVGFDYAGNENHAAALALLDKLGWAGKWLAGGVDAGNVYVRLPGEHYAPSCQAQAVIVQDDGSEYATR